MAQPKMFEVTVTKPTPDAKLGVLFFLPEADGEAMAYGPTIKSLTPNGLLARSTILEAGDKITKVGSEATAGLGSVKTVELLQAATGTFILGVARPPSTIMTINREGSPNMVTEKYCGPASWCIGCFICPCIVLCPVDERQVPAGSAKRP